MSLETRLRLYLGISLALLLGGLWLLASGAVRQLTDDLVASRLTHDAEDLLAAVTFGPEGTLTLEQPHVSSFYARPFSGHYYAVLADGEPLRSRSLWDETLVMEPRAVGEAGIYHAAGPRRQTLVVWSGGFRKQGRALTIAVAEDVSAVTASLARYQGYYAALTLLVLALLLLIQALVVRRSFRPLGRVREAVARLEQGEITRLPEDGVPTEVRPLVAEVNRLLELLAERLRRSRNAVGNLAHTLKGPLTLLGQLSESPELRSHPQVAAELRRRVDHLCRLAERELKRARFGGAGTPGSRFEPAAELPELVQLLERIHHDRVVDIERLVEPGTLPADREDMLELLGNLLDNACKWAAGRVRVTVSTRARTIVVEDDGPGVPDHEVAALTARGKRVDEGTPGHGLGLAIVRDIAEAYGGRIELDRSPRLGGLRVTVTLNV